VDKTTHKNPYNKTYFEGKNSNYWWTIGNYENLKNFPHWQEIIKLLQNFKSNGRLLDIGCAYGLLVNAASKHFESYGIDVSQYAIRKSKKYCRGNISKASATDLPFKSEAFDAITVVDTLEHVHHLKQCLKDVIRVLKKHGILFLQLPNPSIWHLCKHVGLADETHANDFRLKEWESMLVKNGLKVEKRFGLISYAFKRTLFFLKSGRAATLFPELWIVAKK